MNGTPILAGMSHLVSPDEVNVTVQAALKTESCGPSHMEEKVLGPRREDGDSRRWKGRRSVGAREECESVNEEREHICHNATDRNMELDK